MLKTTFRRYEALIRENTAIVAVCVATTVSMLGQGIISPVLPLFAKEFGVGVTQVGLVVSTFGLSRLLFNLPSGVLGERLGRKVLMSGGLLVGAAGLFLTGTAGSIGVMLVWRLLSGVGSAMYMTGAVTYVADISTPDNRGRLMGLQMGSLLLGVDLGPIVGGVMADNFGFRWPFYLAAILSLAAAAWVVVRLAEPRRPQPSPPTEGRPEAPTQWTPRGGVDLVTMRKLLADRTFVLVSLFTLVVFFTRTGATHTLLPLLAVDEAGMSATMVGALFTTMTSLNLLLVLPTGALADRVGRKAVIVPGAVLTIAGLAMFAVASGYAAFFAAGVVIGIGTGIVGPAPNAYAGDLAPAGKVAVTMGLYRTFGDVGFVVGPVLLGTIADTVGHLAWISGTGVAMLFNASLLAAAGLALALLGRETAGKARRAEVSRGHAAEGASTDAGGE